MTRRSTVEEVADACLANLRGTLEYSVPDSEGRASVLRMCTRGCTGRDVCMVRACARKRVCAFVHAQAYLHVCVCVYAGLFACACLYVCAVCARECVYVCVCVRASMGVISMRACASLVNLQRESHIACCLAQDQGASMSSFHACKSRWPVHDLLPCSLLQQLLLQGAGRAGATESLRSCQ